MNAYINFQVAMFKSSKVFENRPWFPHGLENGKTLSSQGKIGKFYPKYWKNEGIVHKIPYFL